MKSKQKIYGSPYYHSVAKLASISFAGLIVFSIISALYGAKHYNFVGPGTFEYMFSMIISVTYFLILLLGGSAIGLIATRSVKISRADRGVIVGTYGFLAAAILQPLFDTVVQLIPAVRMMHPGFYAIEPFLTLAIVALIAVIVHVLNRSKFKQIMAVFFAVFWIGQITSLVQVARVAFGQIAGATLVASPLWMTLLFLLASPLATGLIIYFALRPIGRLSRAFYATFFAAFIQFAVSLLWNFSWGPTPDVYTALSTIALILSFALTGAIVAKLVILRRSNR